MKVSNILIEQLKAFEGCELKAYKCPAWVWTIGVGHTHGVKAGQVITQAQADSLLRADLAYFENEVNKLGAWATQGQFDALVDFAYNLGIGALKSSTLLKVIKQNGTKEEITAQFMRWDKAGGKVLNGLTKRRAWEAKRYFE